MPTITVGTNSYGTEAGATTYWTDRGNATWIDADATDKQVALIKAADYMDRTYTWRGVRATSSQRLGWPRREAYDDDGFIFDSSTIPWQLEEAQYEIAYLYLTGTDLEGVITPDNVGIKKTKVDVIEVEYDSAARNFAAAVPIHVQEKLRALTLSGGRLVRA